MISTITYVSTVFFFYWLDTIHWIVTLTHKKSGVAGDLQSHVWKIKERNVNKKEGIKEWVLETCTI